MQSTQAPGSFEWNTERRPLSRAIAIALMLLALGCGIAGLSMLSPETWGIGLIGFGCLLAIFAVLAQGAEHFTRASMRASR
jgi:hypothetical protein